MGRAVQAASERGAQGSPGHLPACDLCRSGANRPAATGNSAAPGRIPVYTTARDQLPADGHGECLRGRGTRTDDLRPEPSGLEDIEERVAGGDGPCRRRWTREGRGRTHSSGGRQVPSWRLHPPLTVSPARSPWGGGSAFHRKQDAFSRHQQSSSQFAKQQPIYGPPPASAVTETYLPTSPARLTRAPPRLRTGLPWGGGGAGAGAREHLSQTRLRAVPLPQGQPSSCPASLPVSPGPSEAPGYENSAPRRLGAAAYIRQNPGAAPQPVALCCSEAPGKKGARSRVPAPSLCWALGEPRGKQDKQVVQCHREVMGTRSGRNLRSVGAGVGSLERGSLVAWRLCWGRRCRRRKASSSGVL